MATKGWHSRGYIPHFDAAGMVQHIVLCTANSVPTDALKVIEGETVSARKSRIDAALDQSLSGFVFDDQRAAQIMVHALRHFCGSRYDLLAWCVMPNHVHIVLVIFPNHSLGQIVRSWKTFVTWEVNNMRQSEGAIFFKDYFDRYMRNGIQTERAIAYVENNPVAAYLCDEPNLWQWSSAFERAKGWLPNVANLPLWLPK
jgi:REP element-mobilizing transposase RayT